MRLPNAAHGSRPWRVHEITHDFILEDVWALPVQGDAAEFKAWLSLVLSFDPTNPQSLAARTLWRLRDLLGRWCGLGRIGALVDDGRRGAADGMAIPGTDEASLVGRLPDDLRNTVADLRFDSMPFVPLYRTDVEFAAEVSNRTVHGVMHLAWVDQGNGRYQGQMAVYVKPRGLVGKGYMALIKPFRYWVVYPALMRQVGRIWSDRTEVLRPSASRADVGR